MTAYVNDIYCDFRIVLMVLEPTRAPVTATLFLTLMIKSLAYQVMPAPLRPRLRAVIAEITDLLVRGYIINIIPVIRVV